jgi:hypothetical protein
MLALIEYDRPTGTTRAIECYGDDRRDEAYDDRLCREIALRRAGLDQQREVVILGAGSLDAMKRTHGRYFYTLPELCGQFVEAVAMPWRDT